MRRIVLWCMSTLSVLVLLFGYHTSTSSTMASTPSSAYRSGLEPGAPSASGGTSSGPSTAKGAAPSAHARPARTVKGDTVATQWGPVQVALKVKGKQITEVSVPVYPSGSSTDSQINGYALPVLVRETLDQQSARIDMVSGATVTSTGYVQSLQSALDRAGL